MHIKPGAVIGPYRVRRRFEGRSGMARIFEVEVRRKYRQSDRSLPRRLALKVAKEEFQSALVAEADFLSRFDHPNVVRIYPLPLPGRPRYSARARFPFGWGWYYTMELLDGGSLEQQMTRPSTGGPRSAPTSHRRLSLVKAVGIARQLATALQHIHEHHVINLDVKPGNVLFRRRRFNFLRSSVPQAVLCDFGIARDLRYPRAGLLGVATPEYVSPEHALEFDRSQGHILDARADIFSLGVVLYEMLTGTMPFSSHVMIADPAFIPPRPREIRGSIPPLLDEITMRALEKDPDRRFQSAAEMLAALEQVRTPPDWGAAARRFFAVAVVVGLSAGVGLGMRGVGRQQPTPTPTAVTVTATASPTAVPIATATPPSAAGQQVTPEETRPPTSTPVPTSTPTNTPLPPTATPTGTPEGG